MHLLTRETRSGALEKIEIRLERDVNVSDYAILSHRWGRPMDEVSFEDMLTNQYRNKKGYAKLVGCCEQARRDGLRYVWVDTCCINKASSAELSEAITSMFAYYERAKMCYAFLDDVSIDSNAGGSPPSSFSQSAWFTRGWTLQELIAPTHVKFFDNTWSFLGHKTDKQLSPIIEGITGVDSIVLNVPATTKLMSVAKKMSWASRRQTTRVEDMAYSLMGIFGVYMPPLYGEGTHAFIRLQEAIMKTSNDQTIFAWTSPPEAPLGHGFEHVSTMLALSPSQFRESSNFKPLSLREYNKSLAEGRCKLDYATTNVGISIRLPIAKIHAVEGLYAAFLACTEAKDRAPSAIFLRASADTPAGHFWRTNSNNGPVERDGQPWFELSGRDAIATQDIYILPRFTVTSGQNIEPAWERLDLRDTWREGTEMSISGPEGPLAIPTEILGDLHHVPDPGANQLAFLYQAHQMISTQQGDEFVNQVNHWLRFSTAGLPARNRSFFGRLDVLQELTDKLQPSGRDANQRPRVCILSGPKSLGKTEVAVEFSHRCVESHAFGLVLWINASNYDSMIQGFSNIAFEFNLVQPGASHRAIMAAVRLWLSNLDRHTTPLRGMTHPDNWLLVFDGLEDFEDSEDFDNASMLLSLIPSNGPGCVLATTRFSAYELKYMYDDIVLQRLTIQESSEMLKKLTSYEADFSFISTGLAGNPSELMRYASGVVRHKLSSHELALWSISWWKKFESLERAKFRGQSLGHKELASLTWENVLGNISSSTLAVLQVASLFAPYSLDLFSLLKLMEPESRPENILSIKIGQRLLRELWLMTGCLSEYMTQFGVNRAFCSVVREDMGTDGLQKALSTAVALLSASWTNPDCTMVGLNNLDRLRCLRKYKAKMKDSKHGFRTKTQYSRLLKEAGL